MIKMHFTNTTVKWMLFVFLFVFIILFIVMAKPITFSRHLNPLIGPKSQQNILDGCQYVYIDLGTNIGIQIRKLYEPHLYPRADVLPLFQTVFGNHTSEVCSVGFEANPVHTDYLKKFETYCLQRNWRVKIFTSLAVSTQDGNVTLHTEPGNERNNQWGASLVLTSGNGKEFVTVPSVDIVSWFKNTVLTRKIPLKSNISKVMMKHDLEGHDQSVMTDLILRGVYCSIDLIYGEHLTSSFRSSISQIQKHSKSCPTQYVNMDDESYHNIKIPFTSPDPKNTKMMV